MALQLAAGSYISSALSCVGLNIPTQQQKNKFLAKLGSVSNDLCTIDLKSASDLISPALIFTLWPSIWFNLFWQIRSPEIEFLPKMWRKCNMISTMGNGFTFPMMTLTLLGLVYGVIRKNRGCRNLRVDYATVGVYGDDIICPSLYFDELCYTLTGCGLKVNTDKSYVKGPFRESCGGDYYEGVDITPFYIESLQYDPEIYVAINKSIHWACRHGVQIPRLLAYLKSLLSSRPLIVPEWEDPSSGVLSLYPSRSYDYLAIEETPVYRRIKDGFDIMCLLGGFGTTVPTKKKDHCGRYTYTRRLSKDDEVVYTTRKAKLPQGYLDGHDPLYGNREAAKVRWGVILLHLIL
jgi:hypothetical protein